MISEHLFKKILIEPAKICNQLNILSGYASSAMANKHILALPEKVSVNLVVGMVPSDGIGRGNHNGFKALDAEAARFKCNYMISQPAVHVKSYIWLKNGEPKIAFTGSGNYSQNAFFGGTVESFASDDPIQCSKLFQTSFNKSLNCLASDIENKIKFYDEFYKRNCTIKVFEKVSAKKKHKLAKMLDGVDLSLLNSRTGQTHNQSGLNWGKRPGREPNQAYIPIPSSIARSGFFPDRAIHFTLITDDGQSFDCAVAQGGNKAIHTTRSNSLLGKYFRERLGLPFGKFVTKEHLHNYGRTDVKIYKIDDETYYMDFHV